MLNSGGGGFSICSCWAYPLFQDEGSCNNNISSFYGRPLFEKSVIEWTKFLVAWEDLFKRDLKRVMEKRARQREGLYWAGIRRYCGTIRPVRQNTKMHLWAKKSWGMLNKALKRAKCLVGIPQKQSWSGWCLKEGRWELLQKGGADCVLVIGILPIFFLQ